MPVWWVWAKALDLCLGILYNELANARRRRMVLHSYCWHIDVMVFLGGVVYSVSLGSGKMNTKIKLASLSLIFATSAGAQAEMGDCLKIKNKDDKNYCMATYSGSGTYCDKIASFERRQDCMRKVIAKQRSGR